LTVFENWVFRKIFGPKTQEVTAGWRKMYKEERYNFHFSTNIIMMMKSRRMTCMEHVACMGERRNYVHNRSGKS